ncbi:predicted protein [Chaetomium globosum CBS 148.51]|uniref:Uncharacterized protein n=1 Tax=Chaetomium globosum (strain ATCC 6205 / CBS 148.51 / DSM 1962 / NBRC 6347 / NRRL 1970) TaxID=306901 RepID=Q2H8I4_CHAGB|nr:uncharacterized protein CHGG_03470 [Chaetomium globosum CBS 148.51]EAQ91535.1 predicted protein [Chaetomium globosum CBS 148.51]
MAQRHVGLLIRYYDDNDKRCKYCGENGISLSFEELKALRARLSSRRDAATLPVDGDTLAGGQHQQPMETEALVSQTRTSRASETENTTLGLEGLQLVKSQEAML